MRCGCTCPASPRRLGHRRRRLVREKSVSSTCFNVKPPAAPQPASCSASTVLTCCPRWKIVPQDGHNTSLLARRSRFGVVTIRYPDGRSRSHTVVKNSPQRAIRKMLKNLDRRYRVEDHFGSTYLLDPEGAAEARVDRVELTRRLHRSRQVVGRPNLCADVLTQPLGQGPSPAAVVKYLVARRDMVAQLGDDANTVLVREVVLGKVEFGFPERAERRLRPDVRPCLWRAPPAHMSSSPTRPIGRSRERE